MNIENRSLLRIGACHPGTDSIAPSGPEDAGSRSPRRSGETPAHCGKSRCRSIPGVLITSAALCMSLATCVVPDHALSGGSVTVTNHRPGYTVSSLPGGYRRENILGSTYYYHDGDYYRQGSGGYVVVDAPRNSRYYEDYSRRHRGSQPNRGLVRNSDRRHDQYYERDGGINRLPDGYRQVNHRGITYYQVGDRYYRRQGESFMVVNSPY